MRRPWTTKADKKWAEEKRVERDQKARDACRRTMVEGGRPMAMVRHVYGGRFPGGLLIEALENLEQRIVSLEEKDSA